ASNRIGMQIANFSVGQIPDGSASFQLTVPTPGQPNQAVPMLGHPLTLRSNEWQALGSGTGRGTNDWVELYNPETNVVALGGILLIDNPIGGAPSDAIRDLSFIGPQGYAQFLFMDEDND